ncbi:MAG: hypothetical protein KatS3mg105_0849 [Gemmatales bacterium]|nr:MAG: hypothetical protein KatS3mg105_0849 [Gemmatales bacterium]
MNKVKTVVVVSLFMAFAALAFAQGSKVLYPDMKPEKGTYDKPAAKLGMKPATPWTATTVAAAVDGKPLKGKIVTVVGEVVDYSCYLQVGKHGTKHRDCGQKCLQAGMPFGILTKDGTLYLLMEEEHNPRRDGMTDLRKAAIENMAYIVEVTGTLTNVGGQKALFVQGFVKK